MSGCARACDRVLGQTSVGFDDGAGHCTCYSPSNGWERKGEAHMARISAASYPARIASLTPDAP